MAGTDIAKTSEDKYDITFFGGSCQNSSYKSCSIFNVNTSDGEPQLIGVYYDFQAAASGSGAAIKTDNRNSSDTFCPLGWQLPYSGTDGDYYDQSKSWEYLFSEYGYGNDSTGSTGIHSYPISNIYSGEINNSQGYLMFAGNRDSLWSITNRSSSGAYRLESTATIVNVKSPNGKIVGHTIRCVNNFSIPSSTARWQVYM